ncbi:elongator complex protein 6 [Orcinus orca]|uniref:elongator complex protein 6 n=1 Tax=Orcinus orca TaxID=9733 RepID=UPI00211301C9|nr:elongator complex protein 6 [Orcinus orca]
MFVFCSARGRASSPVWVADAARASSSVGHAAGARQAVLSGGPGPGRESGQGKEEETGLLGPRWGEAPAGDPQVRSHTSQRPGPPAGSASPRVRRVRPGSRRPPDWLRPAPRSGVAHARSFRAVLWHGFCSSASAVSAAAPSSRLVCSFPLLGMFPELNNLLNTTPDQAEQGKLTLLCDAKTDGSFLVHHFLSFYLKANCKVCFVALIQSFSHYNIVGQKLGVSLTTARECGQLVFLEGLKSAVDVFFRPQEEPHPLQFLREANSGNLQPLYEFVQEALKPVDSGEAAWRCPVLLVDDLSVLLSLGVGAVAVLDFIHYCRATVCREWKGNVVALVHDSGDAEDEENDILLNGLGHQSHLILRAEGLATGFCKDVHGQLRILWRRPSEPTAQRDRSLTYQYKIQDKNVSFFAKGMSPAVL